MTVIDVGSPRNRPGTKTLKVIERLRKERENRRKSIEDIKRRRDNEIRQNEKQGKPGDVDFQRMILEYRESTLNPPLPHDSVGSLKINVVVRKRPVSETEIIKKDYDAVTCNNPIVHVHNCKFKVDGITKYLETTKFIVDHAFGENSTNEEVYCHTAKPLVDFALNGGRATCFAYGQTGSGKTYTMAGVQSIAAKDIFEKIKVREYQHISIHVAFFELYGGRCIDLLHGRETCVVREDGKGRIHVEGLNEVQVTCMSELLELIRQGNDDRTTHATEMNNVSSRSHAICQIAFRTNSYDKEPFGKLSLIDLAGSERGQDTRHHNKQRRAESAEINKSLLALKECIRALDTTNNKSQSCHVHVPYRVSKLTMVLKDSFSSDAKTVMISCVSPVSSSTDHSLNTLRYADRVKQKKSSKTSKEKAKRRQTINFSTSSSSRTELTFSGHASRSMLRNVTSESSSNFSSNLSRRSDPLKETSSNSTRSEVQEESFDLGMEIDEAIEKFEMEADPITTDRNENESKFSNLDEVEHFSAGPQSGNKAKKKKPRTSQWGEVDYLENYDSPRETPNTLNTHLHADDNDINEFASMTFKDLIAKLVEEEEDLLASHQNTIEATFDQLKDETKLLEKVKASDVVDYDIDEYTEKLEKILVDKLASYGDLYKKLKLFRRHLAMEGVRS